VRVALRRAPLPKPTGNKVVDIAWARRLVDELDNFFKALPSVIQPGIPQMNGGSGRQVYRYSHATDTLKDMLASGYFDGTKLGLLPVKVGDVIVVVPEDGLRYPRLLNVSAVSNGIATVNSRSSSEGVHLEEYYHGASHWDAAFSDALGAMGAPNKAIGPYQLLILPHIGDDSLKISQPITLSLNMQIEGDGGQWGSVINCEDVADTEDGVIKFNGDGPGFIHGIKLYNFELENLKTHGIFCDIKSAENWMIDQIVLSSHSDYHQTVDGLHWAGSEGSTPVNFGHIQGFRLRHVVHSETLHRRTAASIQSINGDFNEALLYVEGFGSGGISVGKMKCELRSAIAGDTGGTHMVHLKNCADVYVGRMYAVFQDATTPKTTSLIFCETTDNRHIPLRYGHLHVNNTQRALIPNGLVSKHSGGGAGKIRWSLDQLENKGDDIDHDRPEIAINIAKRNYVNDYNIRNGWKREDHFLDVTEPDTTNRWETLAGTNGSAVAAAQSSTDYALAGTLRLKLGIDAGETPALNGSAITWIKKVLAMSKEAVLQVRLNVDNVNTAVFIGFTDQLTSDPASLILPMTLTGTTLAKDSAITDCVGFLYDVNATDKTWHMVGVKNGTIANSGAVNPVDSDWDFAANLTQIFRLETNTDDSVDFYIDDSFQAQLANACESNALTFGVWGDSRDTTQRNIYIDYVSIEQFH